MKKLLVYFILLVLILLSAGCEKEKPAIPAAPAVKEYSLIYKAGANGSIEGSARQTVRQEDSGTPVTAVPDEHHHFAGWSDGLKTPRRTDSSITADLEVTAEFAVDQYTLSYTAAENGSIKGDALQKVDHGSTGTEVAAVPDKGYHFAGWRDGVTTASRTDSDLTADLAATATFEINEYSLKYSAGKNGAIEGSARQTVKHGESGTPVTAVPAEHYHFAGWSDGLKTPRRLDSNITADFEVTADFAVDQYTLSYTAAENGSIKGDALQKVDHGSTGTEVAAVPDKGYHFAGWSDGVTTASRTDSDLTADLAATATFEINEYSLKYSAGKNGTLEGITPQTVKHGETATSVTAVAEKGYHFVKWSDGVETPQRIDVNITGAIAVTAIFAENTYSIGGRVSGLVEGTRLVLQNNGGDNLEITANGDFRFKAELRKDDTYDVRVLTHPTSPNQICTVTNSSGTVFYEHITDIEVTCVPVTYTVGGTITGLPEGDRITLRNNETDILIVRANGFFTFSQPLDDGSEYQVEITEYPSKPNWTCDLLNPAGILSGMDVKDILVGCYPKVVLQATAGIRKIRLTWNSYDFNDVIFNLCISFEDIANGDFSTCEVLEGGVLEQEVSSPLILTDLTNDITYWLQMEAKYSTGRQTLSEIVTAIPFGGLNDSGIDWCADNTTNYEIDGTRAEKDKACTSLAAAFPNQDGLNGRDSLSRQRKLSKTGRGSAGFDFTKICRNGEVAGEGKCPPNPLPGNGPANWACTRDNITGLTWEVKTDSGLQSSMNLYTWHNPAETLNGGTAGVKNGGSCEGSDCDTQSYVEAVNNLKLCSEEDWRLPTKMELLSIVDNGRFKPAVDLRFFPNGLPLHFWTSSPSAEEEDAAWQVYFLYGEASPHDKSKSNHVRLVRGSTVTFGLDNQ